MSRFIRSRFPDAAFFVFSDDLEWCRANRKGVPAQVHFGAMLEVPSLAEMLDILLPRVDFLLDNREDTGGPMVETPKS